MIRSEMLEQLDKVERWDLVVIGGGATGLGIAIDAASRGYKTLLLERNDFASGTSSRSTKLIHGGVRYLAQGNIKLVKEALKERGLILKNAPHLSRKQLFVVPSYRWWEKYYYATGLKFYDLLAGRLGIGKTSILSRKSVLQQLPVADVSSLSGGIGYFDGQFDDARLALNMAQTAAEQGAVLLNYFSVDGIISEKKKVNGVTATDQISGKSCTISSKAVINATGVYVDDVLRMEDAASRGMVSPSQGIHLVLDKKFYPCDTALMIPKTADGRVLFAVPWYNRVVVGTTDTPVDEILKEPLPFREEISFIIYHFNKYMKTEIGESDILSIFTGLRPLVKTSNTGNTAMLSRDHTIVVSTGGLITITGGKWTTYRKMAKDAVDNAAFVAKLKPHPCVTENMHIHGWQENVNQDDPTHVYGSDGENIKKIIEKKPELAELLHPDFPFCRAHVYWAVKMEMACKLEDVLARRMRLLFLDVRIALQVAPEVAELMRVFLGEDENWKRKELENFSILAKGYLP
jgi:glycerol-3-phosphate dehydrogenase